MVMDKFEQQFEDLDVQTEYMENTMGQTTAMTTPQDQVEELMQQVADENGLELQQTLPSSNHPIKETEVPVDLSERLAKLRG
jgi:charged multivesicular body protein 1